MIYFIFLSLLLIISLIDYIKNDINNYFFRIFCCVFILLCFVFVAGGRYFPGGGDWSIYRHNFESSLGLNNLNIESMIFEPGFLVLTGAIKLFTSHYIIFFIVIESISCILLFLNITKYTEYRLTSLCIYFSLFFLALDLVMIRSLLAVQIFLFSLRYIYNKKFIYYLICISIAASIHISSIVLLPMYLILNNHYKNKTVLIVILGGIMITLLRIDILTPILRLIPSLDSITYIYEKINSYLNSKRYSSIRPLSFSQIEYLVWFFILMKHRAKLSSYNHYFNIFFNMYLIYGIILLYFIGVNAFSGRLKFFFIFSIIFFIPYFIKVYKNNFSLALFSYCLYSFATTIYYLYKEEGNTIFYFGYKNYFLL